MVSPSSPILSDATGDLDVFFHHINLAIKAGARSLYLLACEDNQFDTDRLNAFIKALNIPVFGGVFPKLVHNKQLLSRGSIVYGLTHCPSIELITNLSSNKQSFIEQATKFRLRLPRHATLLLLLDSFSDNINNLLEDLYYAFGEEHSYLGGAAGSLSLQKKPCIFTNQGILQDCIQIVALEYQAHIGIDHGWKRYKGPYLITSAQGKTLHTLDYRPATEVYREALTIPLDASLDKQNFFDLAKRHPLGIEQIEERHDIARSPLAENGTSLVCLGEMLPNQRVYILQGHQDSLVSAAQQAAKVAQHDLTPLQKPSLSLLFDCVSRALFLEHDFQQELAAIHSHSAADTNLIGALSLGEITRYGHGCLELFNKTALVAHLIEERQ